MRTALLLPVLLLSAAACLGGGGAAPPPPPPPEAGAAARVALLRVEAAHRDLSEAYLALGRLWRERCSVRALLFPAVAALLEGLGEAMAGVGEEALATLLDQREAALAVLTSPRPWEELPRLDRASLEAERTALSLPPRDPHERWLSLTRDYLRARAGVWGGPCGGEELPAAVEEVRRAYAAFAGAVRDVPPLPRLSRALASLEEALREEGRAADALLSLRPLDPSPLEEAARIREGAARRVQEALREAAAALGG